MKHNLSELQEREQRYAEVQKVLLRVLFANLAVTILKIAVGIFTGVLAVAADGVHSLVDSSSNLIGMAAIRLARRPADERHPYGYQRFESLGALAIGLMMLLAAWEIGSQIVSRYLEGGTVEVNTVTLVLIGLTFPVNVVVVLLEKRAGTRLNSEILLADARHTQTDLYVTGSVFVSLVGIWLGWAWLDLVVAAVVVLLIARSAVQILMDASLWLTDRRAVDTDRITEVVYTVPGVQFVHNIRSRGNPEAAFVDLHVKVSPGMSTARAHAIATEVERRLVSQIDSVREALVHMEPTKKEQPTLWERMSEDLLRQAEGMGMGMHELHIHTNENGELIVELHLEFTGEVTLAEAHAQADAFETQVRRSWPDVTSLVTHLEPLAQHFIGLDADEDLPPREDVMALVTKIVSAEQVKELRMYRVGGHLHANIVLTFPGEMLLSEVHHQAEEVEIALRGCQPPVEHVIVHMEPEG